MILWCAIVYICISNSFLVYFKMKVTYKNLVAVFKAKQKVDVTIQWERNMTITIYIVHNVNIYIYIYMYTLSSLSEKDRFCL